MSFEKPLREILAAEIRERGRITFARFMELCLYEPRCGYYNTAGRRLGKQGDFYTSAHTGPLFARLLARRLEAIWEEFGHPAQFELAELGPGDGQLAIELLGWLARRYPEFSPHCYYTAIEQSAELRGRLSASLRPFDERVRVLAELPQPHRMEAASGICGCVFANEFFDALPFHILRWHGSEWQESYVSQDEQGKLRWSQGAVSSPALVEQAELCFGSAAAGEEREEGRVAEVAPLAGQWMAQIGSWLGRGQAIIVDYGYTQEEWREGRFPQGSALAYHQHRASDNLLAHPGEQDLTAHVNFSQLMAAGRQGGLRVQRLVSQEKFLMELGEADQFAELFSDCGTEQERQQRMLLLKNLILPQAMGGTFRVLEMRAGN